MSLRSRLYLSLWRYNRRQMSFCCSVETHFGRERAERDLRDYRRGRTPGVTKLLTAELLRQPLAGKHLLDIGAGIAAVTMELGSSEAASATIVEASPAFLEIAEREIKARYGSRPVQFFRGDFTQIAETVPAADVTILDRVVCCYPDAEALLSGAAAHTREILAFSYPRDRWDVWLVLGYENFMRRWKRNEFQTFVHSPGKMAEVVERAGFVRVASRGTFVWKVEIYKRGKD